MGPKFWGTSSRVKVDTFAHGVMSVPAVCLLSCDLCPETGPFV